MESFLENSSTSIIKTFLLFISIICFKYYQKINKHSIQQPALPPGPKPWPLLGCLPAMWTSHKQPHQWIHATMNHFNTEIACIRLGNTYVIPVTSPELAVKFLNTHDAVFSSRPVPKSIDILSHGFKATVFSPMGIQWKKMKKILVSRILNSSTLRGHITNEADTLLRYIFKLTSENGGGVVNVRSITQHYCGNLIRKMLFNKRYYGLGREDGGPTFEEEEHNQALLTIICHLYAFSVSDFLPRLIPFEFDGHGNILKMALEVIRKYDEPIIDERVRQWKDHGKEVKDILDIFMSCKDENGKSLLSIKEIKAQILELQLATIDNPSNAVEWAMAELMNQPNILKKAVEELDKVVGKDRLVQEHDIPKLKYLTACARESFRLHPFSPFNVPHLSNSNIVVDGYFIPKGSQVLLSRFGLGRNPRIWNNPTKFDPDRHLEDNTVELGLLEPGLRFITFSRGRRGCIGSSFGASITMMLFARILQGFSWSFLQGFTKIEFSEFDEVSQLPQPLCLHVQPRLSYTMYPTY